MLVTSAPEPPGSGGVPTTDCNPETPTTQALFRDGSVTCTDHAGTVGAGHGPCGRADDRATLGCGNQYGAELAGTVRGFPRAGDRPVRRPGGLVVGGSTGVGGPSW